MGARWRRFWLGKPDRVGQVQPKRAWGLIAFWAIFLVVDVIALFVVDHHFLSGAIFAFIAVGSIAVQVLQLFLRRAR